MNSMLSGCGAYVRMECLEHEPLEMSGSGGQKRLHRVLAYILKGSERSRC